jgi:VWFA-related protein
MRSLKLASAAIVALALGSVTAFNQIESRSKRGNSIRVRVNVAATDSAGKPADKLGLADFRIFEDGVRQTISGVLKKETDLTVAFVFDNSGSMRLSLDKFTKSPAIFTDFLRPADEACLVRFVDSDKIEVFQDWTSDKALLNDALENMYVEGGQSAVLDAVYLAAERLRNHESRHKERRHALILVSDAEDRDSYYSLKDVMKLFDDSDVQVFVLSFAENAPKMKEVSRYYASALAFETGGTTVTLPKRFGNDDIISGMKAIAAELRSQYIITYVSTNPIRNDLVRNLKVEIADGANGEKRYGTVRENFAVPKER